MLSSEALFGCVAKSAIKIEDHAILLHSSPLLLFQYFGSLKEVRLLCSSSRAKIQITE
jgi:hypothetical protein